MPSDTAKTPGRSRKHPLRAAALVAGLVASFVGSGVFAQTASPGAPVSEASLRAAQTLDQLVAPIALYPDDLIAIILPASTNPLQVVQAERFLQRRKSDPNLAVNEAWDDSIKALLNYPDVVKKMSDDLDWTSALGNAVYADQGEVLAAIQAFRRMTESAGNLKSDERQVVVIEQDVIRIESANPQVIYVPQYDPATIIVPGGYASWNYWPTPYPVYYYPYAPGAAFGVGLIWGAALGAAWAGGRYVMHYGAWGRNSNIIINRPGGPGYRPGGPGYRPGGGSEWRPGRPPGSRPPQVGYPGGGRPPGAGGPGRPGDGSGLPGAGGPGRPGDGSGLPGAGGPGCKYASSNWVGAARPGVARPRGGACGGAGGGAGTPGRPGTGGAGEFGGGAATFWATGFWATGP